MALPSLSPLPRHTTNTPTHSSFISLYNVWPWKRWQGKLDGYSDCAAYLTARQGLGKGGAKRHRKILRDNIQGECGWLGGLRLC